jgi:hypothetical protein
VLHHVASLTQPANDECGDVFVILDQQDAHVALLFLVRHSF